jgi:hypothetical protein
MDKLNGAKLLKNSCANFGLDGFGRKESTAGNSTYKKLAVQWLNKALCFVSSSVMADNFVLRNRQLLVAAKR